MAYSFNNQSGSIRKSYRMESDRHRFSAEECACNALSEGERGGGKKGYL